LGDLYQVSWEQNEESMGAKETLETQYSKIKNLVSRSTVMQYGDFSFTDLPIGDFIGNLTTPEKIPPSEDIISSSVSSRDIPLHLAYYRYLRAEKLDWTTRQRLASKLVNLVASRSKIDHLFMDLLKYLLGSEESARMYIDAPPSIPAICDKCCMEFHNAYQKYCGKYDDYSLKYAKLALSLCETYDSSLLSNTLKRLCQ